MKMIILIIAILIAFLVVAGCSSTQQNPASPGTAPPSTLQAKWEYQREVSVGMGCYYTTIGYVYNSGNTAVNNAILYLNLVNTVTKKTQDSKMVSLGSIDAGDTVDFKITLDGVCSESYSVEGKVR